MALVCYLQSGAFYLHMHCQSQTMYKGSQSQFTELKYLAPI